MLGESQRKGNAVFGAYPFMVYWTPASKFAEEVIQ
jgi:hypothetical protein